MNLWHLVHSNLFLYPGILTLASWKQGCWVTVLYAKTILQSLFSIRYMQDNDLLFYFQSFLRMHYHNDCILSNHLTWSFFYFISPHHKFSNGYHEFFHVLVPFQCRLNFPASENYNPYNYISFYFSLPSSFFFSDSSNVFTSSVVFVLQEPSFSFVMIFLNML